MDHSRSWKPTKDNRSRVQLPKTNRRTVYRCRGAEQACLFRHRSTPPPAHPFPIRMKSLARGLLAPVRERTGLVAQLASQPNAQA
jgi:hypothetical protein